MAQETIYSIQTSFTAGEVSPEVSARIDLEKYAAALVNAENVYIRPYGAVSKRGGSSMLGRAKYSDKKVVLREFSTDVGVSYLLEFGDRYVRIWKNGEYTGTELMTPIREEDLGKMRMCQSADVLFIATGVYPVQTLSRYNETTWKLSEYKIQKAYFDSLLQTKLERGVDQEWTEPGIYTWTCPADGEYTVEVAGAGGGGGGYAVVGHKSGKHSGPIYGAGKNGGSGDRIVRTVTLERGRAYSISVGAGGQGASKKEGAGSTGGVSTAFDIEAIGGGGGTYTEEGQSLGNGGAGGSAGSSKWGWKPTPRDGESGWVSVKMNAELILKPSGTYGDITLTANKKYFSKEMVGTQLKLEQEVESKTVSQSGSGTTLPVSIGKGWKIITHGTWTGTVKLERSISGEAYKEYRKYTSKDDSNVSESGTSDVLVDMRVVVVAGDKCQVDLTSFPYTNAGVVEITGYISETQVNARVIEPLADTSDIRAISLSSWSQELGYPESIAFFQDRLCFGGNRNQPYMLWMSRTGDYSNFSVDKVDGTITDDSALALSLINRKQQKIEHLVPESDLVALTNGNEWTISGSSPVTPTKANPKVQTSRGSNGVIPVSIGGRCLFVQRRGRTLRDMQYSFETDGYDGADLTLLAKHITKDAEIVDMTYMPDPDSRIYCVLSDGTMACLAYMQDQKVYAWSRLKTDGAYIAVCDIEEVHEDSVYVAVKREDIVYIERLENIDETKNPCDYVMLDCARSIEVENADETSFTIDDFRDKNIGVLADGWYYRLRTDSNGTFIMPTNVQKMRIGLPYSMILELPNIEFSTKTGTIQGRRKKIAGVTIRITNTLGGKIGIESENMIPIKYDEFSEDAIRLYSGDKHITAPNRGFETNGRLVITSDEPYPFNLAAVIREVIVGG